MSSEFLACTNHIIPVKTRFCAIFLTRFLLTLVQTEIDCTLSLNYLTENINLNSLCFKLKIMSSLLNATSTNKQQVMLDPCPCRISQFQATEA